MSRPPNLHPRRCLLDYDALALFFARKKGIWSLCHSAARVFPEEDTELEVQLQQQQQQQP